MYSIKGCKKNKYIIGIDTSNYKTSIAIVDIKGNIIVNKGVLLNVKKGNLGLRQSEAFFQHVMNLPKILDDIYISLSENIKNNIVAISVSDQPRPVENSYMPVFHSGLSFGKVISKILDIPIYTFSHQEGHIQAIIHDTPLEKEKKFIAFHFSGGTTEALLIEHKEFINKSYEIVGGSKDISYGQLIDRIGTNLGMDFPCGREMDMLLTLDEKEHIKNTDKNNDLGIESDIKINIPKIKSSNGFINLSGIETYCQRIIDNNKVLNPQEFEIFKIELIKKLFNSIIESICEITNILSEKYDVNNFLYAGGVSSSIYIRNNLKNNFNTYFGAPDLSTDNAVGVGRLGAIQYATETNNCNTIK